jgi:hypothetical protein
MFNEVTHIQQGKEKLCTVYTQRSAIECDKRDIG